ncbi:hypothetical protein ZWY2020_041350 [Hordeum vulgare]|nr:hypothetical protein ZWY2020_041350 [Hordeum vulgare]
MVSSSMVLGAASSQPRMRLSSKPMSSPVASAMASPKKMKARFGYKGVRVRPSGRWSTELQHESVRYYLGAFNTADLAARAYDIAGWRLGVPREELNFPDITSLQNGTG